ncbi:hypothetical protein GCM10023206_07790 [Acinetobacter puyangensis]|uniref:Uncharacterized protein n=1 Tax=Acinetobacter puyangensis TaxID=1096779 RepID=A0A240E6K4_9GAMM|nr:hypothetical protein [Acinetobacter puyangensis]SNX44141.1 hypothetical protein SAMN05421731_102300 [Acinetobacter puyangensis]
MSIHVVQAHQMYHEYRSNEKIIFVGIYLDHQLMELFNNYNQQLFRILGTYQWSLPNAEEVYFVQDEFEQSKL